MTQERPEIALKGVPAALGVAYGPAFVILQKQLETPVFQVEASGLDGEVSRFEEAVLTAHNQLSELRKEVARQLGEDEAQIFDAHLLVLEDKALIQETIDLIRKSRYNAEYCFRKVSDHFVKAFEAIDDPYLKERVKDIQDVSRRVLRVLVGHSEQTFAQMGAGHIIVSEDISPSDAAALEAGMALGIATDLGSRTSHAVIIAQSLGMPAVVGLHNITEQINSEDMVLIDGYDGLVYLNPTEQTRFRYGKILEERKGIQRLYDKEKLESPVTLDGHKVHLFANIGSLAEVAPACNGGASGIGLFRTEAFFIKGGRFPDEQAQFEAYDAIAEAMAPQPVVMRTLDMGGDKQFSSIGFNLEERNPFMGFRAIRFCLEHPDIFKLQLRAILRASHRGNVRMMFPMISSVEEFLQAKELTLQCMHELQHQGHSYDPKLLIGTMIEVPSAAIVASELAGHCDFFSIGTNDLIQYLLAVDRVNDRIAHLYQPNHPAVLRTIKNTIDAARAQGINTAVCGEMASDPLFVPFLIGAGAAQISVSAMSLPEVKYLIRHIDVGRARALVDEVLGQKDAKGCLAPLQAMYRETMKEADPRAFSAL
jgi:phosphotransferase system enzyme I (PtsI)